MTTKSRTNQSQLDKFKQAARELETDDDPRPLQGAPRKAGEA